MASLGKTGVSDANLAPESSKKKKDKPRYSKQQKRERKEHQSHLVSGQMEQQPRVYERKNKDPPSWQDRVLQCIRKAERTGSIRVEGQIPSPSSSANQQQITSPTMSSISSPLETVRVVTCQDLMNVPITATPLSTSSLQVFVQPLLILDLNGILCHRVRSRKEPPGAQLRDSFGKAAGTPVIPRTDLQPMLQVLDQHFCLAVWTSAKAKTATELLRLLVPREIQQRFLFVWAQHDCTAIATGSAIPGEDRVFEKHLTKVWQQFPLWNQNNTLLMDDSPDKCPIMPCNAIHPPPIHGQIAPPPDWDMPWQSDEDNQQIQSNFYGNFLDYWRQNPWDEELTESSIMSTSGDEADETRGSVSPLPAPRINQSFYTFLEQQASGHMGWRKETP